MSLLSVNQARFIADQLELAIKECSPQSVAIVGCAGGNGLERISRGQLDRVVAVDVNPEYVERTRARHANRLHNLELYCGDIQSDALRYDPVDLTYAALLFEYVHVSSALATIRRNSRPGAFLKVMLQLPHVSQDPVSSSPYVTLTALAPALRLLTPESFSNAAIETGFRAGDSTTLELPSGKQFSIMTFRL